MILARNGEHLLLRAVAQLALPQPETVVGEVGRAPRERRVIGEHFLWRADGDPIVELTHALHAPLGDVFGKRRPPYGGLVEEESVPARGDQKRHARLRIALGKFQRTALEIETVLLILPHAVQLLLLRLKAQRAGVITARDGQIFARHDPQRGRMRHIVFITAVVFLQDLLAVPVKPDLAETIDACGNGAVADERAILLPNDLSLALLRTFEHPIARLKGTVHRGAHAQRVLALRKDLHRLPVAEKVQLAVADLDHARSSVISVQRRLYHSFPAIARRKRKIIGRFFAPRTAASGRANRCSRSRIRASKQKLSRRKPAQFVVVTPTGIEPMIPP